MKYLKVSIVPFLMISSFIVSCSGTEGSQAQDNSSGNDVQVVKAAQIETSTASPKVVEKKETYQADYAMELVQPAEVEMPKKEVELPELPFDKNKLSKVLELDQLIVEAGELEEVHKNIYEEIQKLEEKSKVSMSGTSEDLIKAILVMVNGMRDFERYAKPLAEKGIIQFQSTYQSDSDFSERYRAAYYAAEEQINGPTLVEEDTRFIIEDNAKRREVYSHFRNGYMSSKSSRLSDLEGLLNESEEIRQKMIDRVLSSARTDMMVADYKKGKDLTDVLNSTKNKLSLVRNLDLSNEEIANTLKSVDEKKQSRMEEVLKALEEYRFPESYDGGNTPSDASGLEKRMKTYLEKNDYDVREIAIASGWIGVHNVYGTLMYYQIDFYVAAKYEGSENGVLDILYVTGKTGGADKSSYATYSVGGIAQMLEKNL